MADNQVQEGAGEAAGLEVSEFESLLQKEFRPKSDRSKQAVETAVQTLAEQLLKDTAVVSDDVLGTIQALIAELDQKLTDQV
ncbi:MAG: type VI secretion system contractile sheath large subunit, partial [Pseudomonadota bacterium]